jgi:hypothetical protein
MDAETRARLNKLEAKVKLLEAKVAGSLKKKTKKKKKKKAAREVSRPGPEAAFAAAQAKDHTLNTF